MVVEGLEDFGRLRIGPVALLREPDHPQRTIVEGQDRLRVRDRRLRPRKGTRRAPLVGRLSRFADHDQPARPDDPSLTGFVGPVGAALTQPLDRTGREAPCEKDGILRPLLADRGGHAPDILGPALACPLRIDLDRPAIASPDHEIGAAIARRSFDGRALDARTGELIRQLTLDPSRDYQPIGGG